MSDISKLEDRVDVLFEEENDTKTMYIQGPFAIAEWVDGAGRKFSAELLSREINRRSAVIAAAFEAENTFKIGVRCMHEQRNVDII